MIHVRVPGKVMLAGEYSVLMPGEPCLVAAVDRFLEVDAREAEAWGVAAGAARWVEGEPVPEPVAFVVEAISEIRRKWPAGGSRVLETRDGLRDEQARKLGLGGSAAATVGAVFAAAEGCGAPREELWTIADEVHRRVQGGRGSGADVAASVHGGVVRFVREPRSASVVSVHPEVRFILAWTGESAKTAPRLPAFEAFAAERPDQARLFAKLSREAVATLEAGLTSGHLAQIRTGVGHARAALRGLEAALEVELETPALAAAAEIASIEGAAGKLSGAGGGDCAIVIAVGDAHAASVMEALAAVGLVPLAVRLAGGVHVDRS